MSNLRFLSIDELEEMYKDTTSQLANHQTGVSGNGGQSAQFSSRSVASLQSLLSDIVEALQIRNPEKYGYELDSAVLLDFSCDSPSPYVNLQGVSKSSGDNSSQVAANMGESTSNPVDGVNVPSNYNADADDTANFLLFNTNTNEQWVYSPTNNTWSGSETIETIVPADATFINVSVPTGFTISHYKQSVMERLQGSRELSINNVDLQGASPLIEFQGINTVAGDFVVKTTYKK